MKTVVLGPRPAELQSLIERRHSLLDAQLHQCHLIARYRYFFAVPGAI